LWRTYYASIFNPSRLMTKAMRAEMPRKFWRNLPEASLIPELVRTAPARAQAMRDAAPTSPPDWAEAARRRRGNDGERPALAGMDKIIEAARRCDRCPIGRSATQLVWGEGPTDAPLMIVGEQPGDREDLIGRPFVGPAGALFDQVAEAAGLDRRRAYVTNAVKHFKFAPRGKRRLHQRPNAGEVDACRWWLELEAKHIRPKLALALGATAARALTGSGEAITSRRGRFEEGVAGTPVFLSIHPAFLLRLRDPDERARQTQAFEDDLRRVAEFVSNAENTAGTIGRAAS
ncbi:MAG: UdgX family uracil-DNA binding protein, partial [Pseudomonadota bacterium]